MKNTKSIKLYFTELIKKATPIAAELIESGLLNLEPGTYTAIEIHKILFRRNRDYVLDNHNKADEFRAKDPAELSEWERNYVRRIDHELGWVKMPIENIFYVIMEYEKSAHIAPKDRVTWTVEESRDPVAMATTVFPSEKFMEAKARMVSRFNKPRKRIAWLFLADGGIRGEYTKNVNLYNKKVSGIFKIQDKSFSGFEQYANCCMGFIPKKLKYIYGKCKIYLYGDPNSKNNENIFRIVIENPDGRKISSTEIYTSMTPEQIHTFDKKFTSDEVLSVMSSASKPDLGSNQSDVTAAQESTEIPNHTDATPHGEYTPSTTTSDSDSSNQTTLKIRLVYEPIDLSFISPLSPTGGLEKINMHKPPPRKYDGKNLEYSVSNLHNSRKLCLEELNLTD